MAQGNKNHIFLHHNKKISLCTAILLGSKSKHTAAYWLMMKSLQIIIVTLLISSIMKPLFSPVTNIMKWPSGCFKDYLVCILMLIYYISTDIYFFSQCISIVVYVQYYCLLLKDCLFKVLTAFSEGPCWWRYHSIMTSRTPVQCNVMGKSNCYHYWCLCYYL